MSAALSGRMFRQGRLLEVGRLLAAVTGLPARRRSAAERHAVTGLELELGDDVHRLAEMPALSQQQTDTYKLYN